MKLVTIAGHGGGAPGAMLRTGEIVDLRAAALPGTAEAWIPDSMRKLLAAGGDGLGIVRVIVDRLEGLDGIAGKAARERGLILPADTRLLAPVPDPGLIVAAGLAYRSHLAEMAGTPPPPHPTGFMKSAHSVLGSDAVVPLPPDASEQVDYEGELAVVFGSTCHRVAPADALRHVAGYMAANDFSARDWVRAVWAASAPWDARLSWEVNIMGKQFPGFTSLGPALVTAEAVDLDTGYLTTRINGERVQHGPLSDMIFTVAETIAHFSKWYLFEPGDVLLTGTPAGVGVGRDPPLFLRRGDVVDVEVDGIGTLRSHIGECKARG